MRHPVRANLLVVAVLLLGGCAAQSKTTPPKAPAERAAPGELPASIRGFLRLLPSDADVTRPYEQIERVWSAGVYRTKSGTYKPLPPNAKARIRNLEGRPAIKEERATVESFRPIVLPLPPAEKGE